MKQHDNTDSIRVDKAMLAKIKVIARAKGQTIQGYFYSNLINKVEKEWMKYKPKENEGT